LLPIVPGTGAAGRSRRGGRPYREDYSSRRLNPLEMLIGCDSGSFFIGNAAFCAQAVVCQFVFPFFLGDPGRQTTDSRAARHGY